MAYHGYMTLDGTEIANAARFEKYAKLSPWFHPLYASKFWPTYQTYTSPLTDAAPWYDADVPESADFYGFYPLSVTGLEDSTRNANTSESTQDGGTPGRVRHSTKEVVWSGMIAGRSEAAVEYGMTWLRRATLGGMCSPLEARSQALGAEMVFLGSEPQVNPDKPPTANLASLRRHHRRVVVSRGPVVNAQKSLGCGDHFWMVSFTTTAGDPFTYRDTQRVFSSLFTTNGISWGTQMTAGTTATSTYAEEACTDAVWTPIYDPESGAVITPPSAPNVPLVNWSPPAAGAPWNRTTVSIPAVNFPTWTEAMPVLTLLNDSVSPRRNFRLRFYPDPDGNLDPVAVPCGFSTELVIGYLPPGRMIIDFSYEQVHVVTPGGQTRRADSLVFTTNQRPVNWKPLACGVKQLLTIERLSTSVPFPFIDLDIITKAV